MARPGRQKRVGALVLAVLVFGAAGSDGIRTCPHHQGGTGHGYVHSGMEGGQGTPTTDPGPCDHDLGVCETLASEPALPAPQASIVLSRAVETEYSLPEREFVRGREPTLLLPYSTGPPLSTA